MVMTKIGHDRTRSRSIFGHDRCPYTNHNSIELFPFFRSRQTNHRLHRRIKTKKTTTYSTNQHQTHLSLLLFLRPRRPNPTTTRVTLEM